ncbi:MAG: transketolase [Pirellulaceae bacterium]
MTTTTDIKQTAINTIRTLSMDAVQTANSGHPGTPMALAPVAYQVWNETMRYDPRHPQWANRDRFVLSCGHASMLLYSILHLTGVQEVDADGQPVGQEAISLDNIKKFRQLESPCAGHPEYGEASGIETTTGPLGQGVATSVGMAIASRFLAARYNEDDLTLFDNDVYVLCSDGDLMEGVACEAASLAGHLKLSNLCWIYDDNKITIEGNTDLAFSENQAFRFKGLGWNVIDVNDANDLDSLASALAQFKATTDAPTLIVVRSVIGYGSPNKANTHGAHGAPLGWDEIELTKKAYNWTETEKFAIPAGVKEHFQEGIGARGAEAYEKWQQLWETYQTKHPKKADELKTMLAGDLPAGWDAEIPTFDADEKGMASRVSGGQVLNAIAAKVPWMIGGSADLAPSTNTLLKFEGAGHNSAETPCGRNMHFGIREHAMSSVCNGMSLSGLRSYGATFFVFTDYMRGGMRLSSIMHQPVLYVLTHDSIGLGEDGPTHQPIEHLAACRAMPGMYVFRPGDANEVAECYRASMLISDHPAAMVLSRQNMPTLCRKKYASAEGVAKGGYVIADCDGDPQVILIASGSELSVVIDAYEQLTQSGIQTRVVSMPCMELFEDQDAAYRESVLPASCTARLAVEAGIRQCWDRYLGFEGEFIGMEHFGASGPAEELYVKFGITAKNVVAEAKALLQ